MTRCATKFCRKLVTENAHSPFCSACRSRRFKARWPLKYFFNLLRSGARRRGKEFTLKFSDYEAFCQRTDYHKLKGRTSLSLSIDRKDNKAGYHAWNLDCITVRENCRKDHVPRLRQYAEQFGIKL